jgi:hypothetical protein
MTETSNIGIAGLGFILCTGKPTSINETCGKLNQIVESYSICPQNATRLPDLSHIYDLLKNVSSQYLVEGELCLHQSISNSIKKNSQFEVLSTEVACHDPFQEENPQLLEAGEEPFPVLPHQLQEQPPNQQEQKDPLQGEVGQLLFLRPWPFLDHQGSAFQLRLAEEGPLQPMK